MFVPYRSQVASYQHSAPRNAADQKLRRGSVSRPPVEAHLIVNGVNVQVAIAQFTPHSPRKPKRPCTTATPDKNNPPHLPQHSFRPAPRLLLSLLPLLLWFANFPVASGPLSSFILYTSPQPFLLGSCANVTLFVIAMFVHVLASSEVNLYPWRRPST